MALNPLVSTVCTEIRAHGAEKDILILGDGPLTYNRDQASMAIAGLQWLFDAANFKTENMPDYYAPADTKDGMPLRLCFADKANAQQGASALRGLNFPAMAETEKYGDYYTVAINEPFLATTIRAVATALEKNPIMLGKTIEEYASPENINEAVIREAQSHIYR